MLVAFPWEIAFPIGMWSRPRHETCGGASSVRLGPFSSRTRWDSTRVSQCVPARVRSCESTGPAIGSG